MWAACVTGGGGGGGGAAVANDGVEGTAVVGLGAAEKDKEKEKEEKGEAAASSASPRVSGYRYPRRGSRNKALLFVAAHAARPASGICQGMSWQHLHQPV